MGYQNDIQAYQLISVTTGDGKEYNLKMRFKGGSIDPLTASYNYAGKVGTKPTRNSSASPVYDFTFFVHQDIWKDFKNSISDPSNDWLVKHPLYGDLKGQPTSMSWNPSSASGDVEFTIQYQEGIIDQATEISVDYNSRVLTQNLELQDIAVINFTSLDLSLEELNILDEFIDNLEDIYESVLNSDIANLIYDARQVLIDVTFNSARFISITNQLLNIPSTLSINNILYPLKTRLDLIKAQSTEILNLIPNVNTESPDGNTSDIIAKYKELTGAVNIGSMSVSIATPSESQNDVSGFDITDNLNVEAVPDYKYKKDVDKTISDANDLLNDYINSIDSIDIQIQGFINYTPNNTVNSEINSITILAIQEVKEISKTAKEEKTHFTESDTIPELLAFKLYGIASDENVNEIINNNDLFGKNSIANSWRNLVIRKNTKILYYA